MRIYDSSFDPIRPDRPVSPTSPVNRDGVAAPSPVAPIQQTDRVEISSAGRSMASRVEAEQRSTLDPERVAELRRKVLEGAYNTLDVVDQVARRIMQRGDL